MNSLVKVFSCAFDIQDISMKDMRILNDILHRYTEPHRVYHNFNHLVDMCDNYINRCLAGEAELDQAMCLAILYHDAVYHTDILYMNSSEEDSCNLLREVATSRYISDEVVNRACELIMHTTDHSTPDLLSEMDLEILGYYDLSYDEYVEGIMMEWSHLDHDTLIAGRVKFLQEMLSREQIFNCPVLEEQARENMNRELKKYV